MASLREALERRAAEPGPPFAFEVGQKVRVRKTLTTNVHAITHLLGREGTVESRRTTWLHKINSYNVRFESGEVEPFEGCELDRRYIRRKGEGK